MTVLLLLISPLLWLAAVLSLALTDLVWLLRGGRAILPGVPSGDTFQRAQANSATVVIPNWNGRDLLERYLPSVIAALAGNSENEIIVVDYGSEDRSAEFCAQRLSPSQAAGSRS